MEQKQTHQKQPDKIPGKAAVPRWKEIHPEWVWDRLCTKCSGKTGMESPRVYNIEIFECLNPKCRARHVIKTYYDKHGKLTREELLGVNMENEENIIQQSQGGK